jgi:hypothetical protein
MWGRVGARETWSPAHRLITGLAVVTALFDLVVLLPGNPYWGGGKEFVAVVLIQALVLWGLWRGSAVAWWVAVIFSTGQIVSWILMSALDEPGVVGVLALSVVMTAILFTREVRGFIKTHGREVRPKRSTYPPA